MSSFLSVTLLSIILLSSSVWVCQANNIPPGGCVRKTCSNITNLPPPTSNTADKRIAFIYGRYNTNLPALANNMTALNYTGGPSLNYEVVSTIELPFLISGTTAASVTTLGGCCSLCAETDGCSVYMFYTSGNISQIKVVGYPNVVPDIPPANFVPGQQCYLLTGGSNKKDGFEGTPPSGKYSEQISTDRNARPNRFIPPAFVGGHCNPQVRDDPHFTGAKGTRFDFNGEIGRTVNLISDVEIHINIRLGGFLDDNTAGASRVVGGKGLRTWIKELGFLWVFQGQVHSAVLSAREGKDQERGTGFLSSVVIDGQSVAVPVEGFPLEVSGLTLEFKSAGTRGSLDIETFSISVGTVFSGKLKLRAAHPLLQLKDDAFVHFNLQVTELEASPRVHGVLGQTFRESTAQHVKALEYRTLNMLLGGPVVADGSTGMGFLEGKPDDYFTSSLTAADSVFSVPLAV